MLRFRRGKIGGNYRNVLHCVTRFIEVIKELY
jgi:hypothetical protein